MTVYYSQEDKGWANIPYTIRNDPKQTIGTSACGPTCFAMVASTFGDKPILPPEAAKWAVDNGYRTADSGTKWSYFAAAAKKNGLTCLQTSNLATAKQALAAGALVIVSMGPGHLTGGGHYVLMVSIKGKWIEVYDPNHDNRKYGNDGLIRQGVKDDGIIEADELVFVREARQYWVFPQPEPTKNEEDEAMTDTERKQFEAMSKKVDELTSKVTTLTMAVKDATEVKPAPAWFVKEFGEGVLSKINNPTGTLDFWRSLAVSLRVMGFKI
ncbi:C39 family peptidase [Cohnella boryungensis]|uniref:C39 family peptidase n=1 Tax=Cohnella boryungensis TaxID=768479 RepID=A0ABV8SE60_9BACL